MRRNSMLNPFFAQRAWSRSRASRPLSHMHPADEKRFEAARQKEQLQGGQAQTIATSRSQQDPITPELPTMQQEGDPTVIKLNCGISRKIGEPNYGSRGASVNLELELDSNAVSDPQKLQERIRRLFAMAKAAVDEELGTGASTPATNEPSPSPAAPPSQPTNGQQNGNGNAAKPATESQRRAIWAICNQLGVDQDAEARRSFQKTVSQLSVPEASKFIDHLKQVQVASGPR